MCLTEIKIKSEKTEIDGTLLAAMIVCMRHVLHVPAAKGSAGRRMKGRGGS